MADKYDELLRQGLIKLKEIEFSDVPKEEEIEHGFSDKYLKSKEKLVNKLSRSYWKYVNTVAKKVAVIIISFIIAFSSLMSVDAFRKSVIDFVITVFDSFSKVEQNFEVEKQIETYYSIDEIPSIYVKTISYHNKSMYVQIWDNFNGNQISLNQVSTDAHSQFNSEHGELYESIINNTPCLNCEDPIQYYCYWEFDGYRFELIYPIDLGEEFMSEVVGHLVEVDPKELTTE